MSTRTAPLLVATFAALGMLLAAENASAQTLPIPSSWPMPAIPPSLPTWPTPQTSTSTPTIPTDLSQWLQNATAAANQCPPIEIAPGVHVPVCANALPKPPPNVIVPEALLTIPPLLVPTVDLRLQNLDGPIKDQKQTGVCYAFAVTTVMESSMRRQGRADVLSPLHFVAANGWQDLWRQQSQSEAIGLESSWPYDPIKACKFETGPDECERAYGVRTGSWQSDPALVAERERQRGLGVASAGKASAIRRDPINGIAAALASGRAVYAAIAIDSRAWGYRGVKNGVIAEYDQADRGGHAIAIVGYRTIGASRQYLLHNSWGNDWGDRGFAWMSDAGLRRHLLDAYLIDATPRGATPLIAAPTLPTTTTTTTNTSTMTCAPGTALDIGAGRCAALCRSGAAPFMGQCWFG